jgi:hypothetical protein
MACSAGRVANARRLLIGVVIIAAHPRKSDCSCIAHPRDIEVAASAVVVESMI